MSLLPLFGIANDHFQDNTAVRFNMTPLQMQYVNDVLSHSCVACHSKIKFTRSLNPKDQYRNIGLLYHWSINNKHRPGLSKILLGKTKHPTVLSEGSISHVILSEAYDIWRAEFRSTNRVSN